jgi:NhaP-type Na+/H+ or K+/H+ antiporter
MGLHQRYRAGIMSIELIVRFIVLLLVLALIAEPLAAKLRLPHSSLLVLFTLLVQAPSKPWLINKTELRRPHDLG